MKTYTNYLRIAIEGPELESDFEEVLDFFE